MLHSSAAGDWVNCGICGEWAHFGCDRRQGLGAFKVCFTLSRPIIFVVLPSLDNFIPFICSL